MDNVNAWLAQIGLERTRLRRHMLDVKAAQEGRENTSTPRELVTMLRAIHEGRVFGKVTTEEFFKMLSTQKSSYLPRHLPADLVIANKPGNLDPVRNDAASSSSPPSVQSRDDHPATDGVRKEHRDARRLSYDRGGRERRWAAVHSASDWISAQYLRYRTAMAGRVRYDPGSRADRDQQSWEMLARIDCRAGGATCGLCHFERGLAARRGASSTAVRSGQPALGNPHRRARPGEKCGRAGAIVSVVCDKMPMTSDIHFLVPIILMSLSALLVLALGVLHLVYTFRGPKLTPRDPALQARMAEVHPVITRQTTMWRAWVGFNASHSMGAILFGLVYGFLANAYPEILFSSPFLLAVGLAMLGSLAVLGKSVVRFRSAALCHLWGVIWLASPRGGGLSALCARTSIELLAVPFAGCFLA
jgi:hypothetical protein